jgi:hypothetical protein
LHRLFLIVYVVGWHQEGSLHSAFCILDSGTDPVWRRLAACGLWLVARARARADVPAVHTDLNKVEVVDMNCGYWCIRTVWMAAAAVVE